MSYIAGWGVSDRNTLFRLLVIFFAGLVCFAVLLTWRAQLLLSSQPYSELTPRPRRFAKVAPQVDLKDLNN